MPDKKYLIIIAAVLAGVVFSDKIRALPVIGSKIPTV
jgi:hypothetical protein